MGASLTYCIGKPSSPEAIKLNNGAVLQAWIKSTGSVGDVLKMDPEDDSLTYKVMLGDGSADWHREDDVELQGKPMDVLVLSGERQVRITGINHADPLSALHAKVQKELGLSNGRFTLATAAKLLDAKDMNRSVGLLGLADNDVLICTVVDFEPELLRIESVEESEFSEDQRKLIHKVIAFVYGRKGTKFESLLWASHIVEAADGDKTVASLSDDSLLLLVTKPGSEPIRLQVADLIGKAKARKSGSLLEQLKARFCDDPEWPRILGRMCRKIA